MYVFLFVFSKRVKSEHITIHRQGGTLLLAIDVGNTQTVIGLFKGSKLLSSWRMVTPKRQTSDEIGASMLSFMKNSGYEPGIVTSLAVSCVVPAIFNEIDKMGRRYFGCDTFMVDGTIKTNLKLDYDHPQEIGATGL